MANKRCVCRALALAGCSTLFANLALGDPPVLTWNDAAGIAFWDAASLAWLDSTNGATAWQPGAEALFAGTGGTVEIAADVSATNLAFSGTGYLLQGTNTLALEGTLSTVASTSNSIAASLRSSGGITKNGEGLLALSGPSVSLASTLSLTQGSLTLQGTALPGQLSADAGTTVAVLPAPTHGLTGFYYSGSGDSSYSSFFSSVETLDESFSKLTPDLVVNSSLSGTGSFSFGTDGSLFPLPYGQGGDHANYFGAVWRGVITVPTSATYQFHVASDDGFVLGIDRKTVASLTGNSTADGAVYLDAGPHDIVVGFFQITGPYYLLLTVKTPSDSEFSYIPNSWLTPYTAVGAISGNGTLSISAGGAFNAVQNTNTTFGGALALPAGSILAKNGNGNLTMPLSGLTSNALTGDLLVENGVLALTAAERLSDSSTARLGSGGALQLAGDETLAALSGPGTVTLGSQSRVYVKSFSGDADSDISTSKNYTHLLDFPDNGNPATVNGVTFTSAGMSGSANGYSWSTVNPPYSPWGGESDSGITQLLYDFYYNSADYTTTLSGLKPGQAYETRLYFRSYTGVDPAAPRKVSFYFTSGSAFVGAINFNPDAVYARSWVGCRFTADASGSLAVHVVSHNLQHTCHLYALSNEEVPLVGPSVTSFASDADSGLSTSKTYTHLLDFPDNGNPATVNGVTFTPAAMSGSANGYSWSTVNPPTGAWNDAQNDSTRSGIDRLLWDFFYGSTDYTMTLAGLHPGQSYEVCLYFRSFGTAVADSTRDVTFTFKAGATSYGSVDHDLDTMSRSIVRCRYTADAAGTLDIHVLSHNNNDTCHLYGLSNAEASAPALTSWPTLTLNMPAGITAHHTGGLAGYGTLVKKGGGTQVFGGGNGIVSALDVQEGHVVFESGASVLGGVIVHAGTSVSAPNGGVYLGSLQGTGTFGLNRPTTNQASMVFFSDDATTGISSNKTYTHLLDFGQRSPVATVNGVTFTKAATTSGTLAGDYGFSGFPPIAHGGAVFSGVPIDSGIYNLLYDMDYGLQYPGSATMQLTGLTPGKCYEVHLFNRSWGWGNDRTQTVTFDPDGDGPIAESVTFNPDSLYPNYVSYRYMAASSVLNIAVASKNNNQTLHLYGLSNEEVPDSSTVVIDTATDCVFGGVITGEGSLTKKGSASLTLTNANTTASGALTVAAGAFGVANGGHATTGAVTVASGATLFGDGSIGGAVSIASNATLHAGTAGACGTLRIGGSLSVSEGANLSYRYSASGSDTVTVGGTLTFPTNGVLQVSSFTAGLKPPAKGALFVSSAAISGPDDLTGWSIEGADNATLKYSSDRTTIYFSCPRGTLLYIR